MSTAQSRRKTYSQNFLHDRRLIGRIVSSAGLDPDDLVIEIGPGTGALTRELLCHCHHVLAVEKDPELVRRLGDQLGHHRGLTLFSGDFLTFPLPHTPYKVFANLPFRSTSAMLDKLTTGTAPPDDMFLVMQREAAERFMGQPHGTMLATQLVPWFSQTITYRFRRSDFRPQPAVDSVLLHICRRGEALLATDDRLHYRDLVAAVYSAWKPTVQAALSTLIPRRLLASVVDRTDLDLNVRPSALPPVAWIDLYR